MNEYLRRTINSRIKKGIEDAKNAIEIRHPYLVGKLREIVLAQLIEPMLNKRFSYGTGKIMDYIGNQSSEVDICLYSENLHPPLFFSEKEKLALFPVESVLSLVEIKSKISKANLQDTYKKFKYVEENLIHTPGVHDESGNAVDHYIIKQKYSIFAFDIQSKKYSPQSIFDLYKKIDSMWDTNPLITNICIVDKGWFTFTGQGWLYTDRIKESGLNEEAIGFLCSLVQDLPRAEESRGIPRIMYYLFDPYITDRFIDGEYKKDPWGKGVLQFRNIDLDKLPH